MRGGDEETGKNGPVSSTEPAKTIYEKCKNHVISLLLIKSSTKHKGKDCKSKIMGGLSPVQIKNYSGFTDLLPNNSSFVFFYDED